MNLVKKIALTLGVVSLAGTAVAEVNQPLEIVNRPLTLPAGQGEAGLGLGFLFIKDADPNPFKLLNLGGGYGVNEKLEVRLQYTTCLEDGCDFKGPLALGAAYGLSDGGPLHLAADASIGYNTLSEAITPLGLGVRVRYNLDDKMAVYSPGQQLTITIDDQDTGFSPIYLSLPVGFGYQATPNLFVAAETNIADIEISDYETQFIFDNTIPLGLRAFYAVNNMIDVGLGFDIDLDNTDASALSVSARGFF